MTTQEELSPYQQLERLDAKVRFIGKEGRCHAALIDNTTNVEYVVYPPMNAMGMGSDMEALMGALNAAKNTAPPLTKAQQAVQAMNRPIAEENERLRKELDELRRKMEDTNKPSGKSHTPK